MDGFVASTWSHERDGNSIVLFPGWLHEGRPWTKMSGAGNSFSVNGNCPSYPALRAPEGVWIQSRFTF